MTNVTCSHCGVAVDKADAMEVQLKTKYFLDWIWDLQPGAGTDKNDVHLCPKCRKKLGEWLTKAMPCEFKWNERM